MAKKIEGTVFRDDFHSSDQASPRLTVWQDMSIDKTAKIATVIIHEGKPERVFTESEVRAMFQVLRSNEFFEDGGATLMHIDDFNARVQTFFSDPA